MKALLLVLLAGSGLATACRKELAPSTATIGQPFKAVYQQPAILPAGSGGPVRITLTEVQESRCPSGVQCFWGGYVAVTVELADEAATPQTARISLLYKNLPNYAADSVAVTLNQRAYWLRLLDVSPYPSAKGSSAPQTATLRLRPR